MSHDTPAEKHLELKTGEESSAWTAFICRSSSLPASSHLSVSIGFLSMEDLLRCGPGLGSASTLSEQHALVPPKPWP